MIPARIEKHLPWGTTVFLQTPSHETKPKTNMINWSPCIEGKNPVILFFFFSLLSMVQFSMRQRHVCHWKIEYLLLELSSSMTDYSSNIQLCHMSIECNFRPPRVSYLVTSSTVDWHKPLLYPCVVDSSSIPLTAALVARKLVTTYRATTGHPVCLIWELNLCFNLDSKYLCFLFKQ